MNVARAVARVESVNFAGFCSGFYWLESGEKYIDNICPASARAVARARPVGKICRNSFRFLLAEKWKKKYIDNICPRECPSGSEGFTCGENWPDFVPVFVG